MEGHRGSRAQQQQQPQQTAESKEQERAASLLERFTPSGGRARTLFFPDPKAGRAMIVVVVLQ